MLNLFSCVKVEDSFSCDLTNYNDLKKSSGTRRKAVKRKKHFQYLIKFIKCA